MVDCLFEDCTVLQLPLKSISVIVVRVGHYHCGFFFSVFVIAGNYRSGIKVKVGNGIALLAGRHTVDLCGV